MSQPKTTDIRSGCSGQHACGHMDVSSHFPLLGAEYFTFYYKPLLSRLISATASSLCRNITAFLLHVCTADSNVTRQSNLRSARRPPDSTRYIYISLLHVKRTFQSDQIQTFLLLERIISLWFQTCRVIARTAALSITPRMEEGR